MNLAILFGHFGISRLINVSTTEHIRSDYAVGSSNSCRSQSVLSKVTANFSALVSSQQLKAVTEK